MPLPNFITTGAYLKTSEATLTNLLVVAPGGVSPGNRLLLVSGTRGVSSSPNASYIGPDNWLNIASVSRNVAEMRVWTKIADGTESSVTHTIVAHGGPGAAVTAVMWMFDSAAQDIEGINTRSGGTTTVSAIDVVTSGPERLAFNVLFTQNISTLTTTLGGTTGGIWVKKAESDSAQNAHLVLYTCPLVADVNVSSGSSVGGGASNWFSWGGAFFSTVDMTLTLSADGLLNPATFGTVPFVIPPGAQIVTAYGTNFIGSGTSLGIPGLGVPMSAGNILAAIPTGLVQSEVYGAPDAFIAYSYNTDETGSWSFVQYGNNVFATNNNDPIQVYSLGAGGVFANIGGGAPRAKALSVVKNFLVAVNTLDDDGRVPQRVRWCAIDNPFSWTLNATTQADFQDLLGEGGANQCIASGLTQADAVVMQERAVWRMTYQGTPSIFTFDLMEGIRGTPAPGSLIVVGGTAYYYGEDGFYGVDGSQSIPIGEGRVNRMFQREANQALLYRMYSAVDIARKLIFWSYATADAVYGNPDRILVYNWSTGEMSILKVTTEALLRTKGLGYTLEDLDSVGDIDSIVSSLDSREWSGKRIQLSAFDENHRIAHFSGPNMAATITTKEITMPDPGKVLVSETWPIVDTKSSSTGISVAVGTRQRGFDTVSFAIASGINRVGYCPQRVQGQYVRFQVSISSSVVWERVTGVDVKFSKIGKRR